MGQLFKNEESFFYLACMLYVCFSPPPYAQFCCSVVVCQGLSEEDRLKFDMAEASRVKSKSKLR